MKFDPLERLYHRNYGLPNSTRRKVLEDASLTTVKRAAAEHKVSAGTIYMGRRHIRAYEKGYADAALEQKG